MRILLLEDERRMAQGLCEILRVEKYEVDHYADGISGLEALESGLYDLAVLDVMLPGRSGDFPRKNPSSEVNFQYSFNLPPV